MSVLDKVRDHGARGETHSLEVPEWGEKGKPLVIKYQRPSLTHTANAMAAHPDNPIRQNVDIFCQIAIAEDGSKMFKRVDGADLMEQADPMVMGRLLREMGIIIPTDAEAEKN